MSKSTKLSHEEWLEYLNLFFNGNTLSDLVKSVGYGLPFFSTKLKKLAISLNLEQKYLDEMKRQKIIRNGGVDYSAEVELYVQTALANTTEWRKIPDYEDYYVSNGGLVKGKYGTLLTLSFRRQKHTSYVKCSLYKQGKINSFQVHQLVMRAFNPTSDSTLQIDHLDNNGLNNSITNLEWVTASENIQRSFQRNNTTKKEIASKGGKTSAAIAITKAESRLKALMEKRFISLENSNVTYLCERCGQQFTTDITSKAFRYGWKGVCTPCKRIITKEGRLNAKLKQGE